MKISASLIALSLIASPCFADQITPNTHIRAERTKAYWFQTEGLLKFDTTVFSGDTEANNIALSNGSNIRDAALDFTGGIGNNWSYNFEIAFDGGRPVVTDAFVTWDHLSPCFELSIGQVASYFALENSNSGKWIPFMERSLPTVAFAPSMGLGAQARMHFADQVAVLLSAVQPFNNTKNDPSQYGSDRWTGDMRVVWSPVHTAERVYDLGFTVIHSDEQDQTPSSAPLADVRFSTRPEARARSTTALLDTQALRGTATTISSVEAAGLWGPLVLETEYFNTHVNRSGGVANLNFHGWYLQASYVLTGEARQYNFSRGAFGKITPKDPCGAWEVASRYSYLNLNDAEVHGGSEHNIDLSISWFVNSHLRLLANYIRASIHPFNSAAAMDTNIYAARAQVVW